MPDQAEVQAAEGREVRELDERRRELRGARRREALPAGEDPVQRDAEERREQNSEQERAAHAPSHEPSGQEEAHEEDDARQPAEGPEPDRQRARRGLHDEARGEEADEGDEETDPDADRPLEPERYRVHRGLAEARQHEERDRQTLEEDDRHRLGPREPAPRHELEGDDRVQPHPGGERQRVVAREPHENRQHAGGQTRDGQRRAERQALALQAGDADIPEDDRVHEDDIGHDHESGQASADLGCEVGAALGEPEEAIEGPGHVPGASLPQTGLSGRALARRGARA